MRLEKRGESSPASAEDKKDNFPDDGKKPVIVYILILFIVAFLLMALSLLMHQRSNTEALGQLNASIAAMRDVQNGQERIEALEKELEEANAIAQEFQDANESARNQASNLEHTLERTREAMDLFWRLDEAYALGDTERCAGLLTEMAQNPEDPLQEYLSPQAAERYEEIRAALWGSEGAS